MQLTPFVSRYFAKPRRSGHGNFRQNCRDIGRSLAQLQSAARSQPRPGTAIIIIGTTIITMVITRTITVITTPITRITIIVTTIIVTTIITSAVGLSA